MNLEVKLKAEQDSARCLIYDMIETSIKLSLKKAKHPLTKGCICFVCVNTRKELLREREPKKWKYTL